MSFFATSIYPSWFKQSAVELFVLGTSWRNKPAWQGRGGVVLVRNGNPCSPSAALDT